MKETFTRYRTPVGHVKRGMYVAELDRPWLDTPFLMQGFVVDTADEIAALQAHCNEVYVELERSRPEIHEAILTGGELVVRDAAGNVLVDSSGRPFKPVSFASPENASTRARAEGAGNNGNARIRAKTTEKPRSAAPPNDSQRGRNPDSAPPPTARRGAGRAPAPLQSAKPARARPSAAPADEPRRSLWQRIREALGFGKHRRGGDTPASLAAQVRGMPESLRNEIQRALPAGQRLTQWTDTRAIEEELPRARVAMDRGEKVLATLFSDVRRGRIPQVEQVSDAMAGVADSMIENPDALLWVAHLRDRHTRSYQHAMRVALYMVALGRQLGFPRHQLASLGSIGLLADIGKTKVPQALLDKPAMLTPEEFEKVKQHVSLGVEMLAASGKLSGEILSGIVQHHERLDGSGYPNGLAGSEIGLYGKMAAIADAFAAMTSSRPYGNPAAPHAALMHLFAWAGKFFHEPLVEQFVQALGVFPVGSLVELTSEEVAVVLAHNRARRLEPRVLLLTDENKAPLAVPRELDLIQQKVDDGSPPIRIRCGLAAGAYNLDPATHYANALQPSTIDADATALASTISGTPPASSGASRTVASPRGASRDASSASARSATTEVTG